MYAIIYIDNIRLGSKQIVIIAMTLDFHISINLFIRLFTIEWENYNRKIQKYFIVPTEYT